MSWGVGPGIWLVLVSVLALPWGAALSAGEPSATVPSTEPPLPALRSLGVEEIRGLRQGEGMGLARPAELNGYPGPAHVLEAARQGGLDLYADQRQAIERIYAAAKAEARALGQQILSLEAALEAGFRSGRMSEDDLARRLEEIGRRRTALRLVHLRAHLLTTALLRPEQVEEYYQFRGYTGEPVQRHHGY